MEDQIITMTKRGWLREIERATGSLREARKRYKAGSEIEYPYYCYCEGYAKGMIGGAYFAGVLTEQEHITLMETVFDITTGKEDQDER